MPTISIRISEDLKNNLSALAHDRETTVSAIIVDTLNSITGINGSIYSKRTAPYSINSTNRLILRNQEFLLSINDTLDKEERECHKQNYEILENGFTSEYSKIFAKLQPEIPFENCEELYDILDMFRVLRVSYDQLDDCEKSNINEIAISFRGFDYSDNDESLFPGYIEYLFENNCYKELEKPLMRFSDDGNSHHSLLETYRRMNRCFKEIWHDHFLDNNLLNAEEIKKIISASNYNSEY